ncbi:MAG: guanylate kinase [Nitrospinota bacterium]
MWSDIKRKGILFVVSAPSGAGKTTLVDIAKEGIINISSSISHTTRAPRAGEENGREYHFVDRLEFKSMIERGEFLEWAEVFGNFYGTSVKNLEIVEKEGKDLLFVIDVQGAEKLRKLKKAACSIFILPPSLKELEARLVKRAMDSTGDMRRRLETAPKEIAQYKHYDYVIVNKDVEDAALNLRSIILAERCRNANLIKP